MLVHLDVAVLRLPHAHTLQVQPFDVRVAAGGVQHHVGIQRAAVAQAQAARAPRQRLDALHVGAGADVDAGLAHLGGGEAAHLFVKAAQHLLAAVDQRHGGAQPMEDAGHLTADIAAAHHHEALGEGGQVEHLVRHHHQIAARKLRHEGAPAGGDQDVPRRHRALGPGLGLHAHRVRIDQAGVALQPVGARAGDDAFVNAVQPGDLGGAVRFQRRPVQCGLARQLPAKAARFGKRFGVVRGKAVQLLGDAAHVHAGAAHATAFGQAHARAALRRKPRRPHAAGAAADDEKVVVEVGHRGFCVGAGDMTAEFRRAPHPAAAARRQARTRAR